jgi:hypothetical protein
VWTRLKQCVQQLLAESLAANQRRHGQGHDFQRVENAPSHGMPDNPSVDFQDQNDSCLFC